MGTLALIAAIFGIGYVVVRASGDDDGADLSIEDHIDELLAQPDVRAKIAGESGGGKPDMAIADSRKMLLAAWNDEDSMVQAMASVELYAGVNNVEWMMSDEEIPDSPPAEWVPTGKWVKSKSAPLSEKSRKLGVALADRYQARALEESDATKRETLRVKMKEARAGIDGATEQKDITTDVPEFSEVEDKLDEALGSNGSAACFASIGQSDLSKIRSDGLSLWEKGSVADLSDAAGFLYGISRSVFPGETGWVKSTTCPLSPDGAVAYEELADMFGMRAIEVAGEAQAGTILADLMKTRAEIEATVAAASGSAIFPSDAADIPNPYEDLSEEGYKISPYVTQDFALPMGKPGFSFADFNDAPAATGVYGTGGLPGGFS